MLVNRWDITCVEVILSKVAWPKFLVTPKVNFTNILRAAFTLTYYKSTKRTLILDHLFALLGSASIKAAHKSTLMKLTPGRNLEQLLSFTRYFRTETVYRFGQFVYPSAWNEEIDTKKLGRWDVESKKIVSHNFEARWLKIVQV